ncbi:hypothetical protein [Gordonia sp. WA4-43]|uniref:hypothetical protein n=1 Tax=Gordonia sp. WA4-43 TaxID=2878678 RepID=UPI001CFBE9CF|nr:hypothetical protein [Gordonia sp. WA4-43]UCZ89850.1 hypothetical protein LEL84_23075 [Gordonia sp. WA4-43]
MPILLTDGRRFSARIPDPPHHRTRTCWSDDLDDLGHIDRADAIVGWRLWWLLANGDQWGLAEAALTRQPDGHRAFESLPAECRTEADLAGWYGRQRQHAAGPDHEVPDPDCTCGYCVVRDLEDLVDLFNDREWAARVDERARTRIDDLQNIPILTCVSAWGVCAEGMPYDPWGTARVQHCAVRYAILPATMSPEWVDTITGSGLLKVLGTANFGTLQERRITVPTRNRKKKRTNRRR